jgi:hypothetical protein
MAKSVERASGSGPIGSTVEVGDEIVDGSCCYQEHEVFVPPESSQATIWRYLDFTKLVSLLDTQRLFFARVDSFEDPFEGSVTAATREARRKAFAAKPDADMEKVEEAIRWLSNHARSAPRWMYANCWNLSEVESAALWNLYSEPSRGVAIQSTYARLINSFLPPPAAEDENVAPLLVGKVSYVDYDEFRIPDDNTFRPFVHKRKSFEFENELRAMTWHMPSRLRNEPTPFGVRVPVDLEKLIEAIHISPTAPPWFASLVESVAERFGCPAPVKQSSLSGEPLY